MPIQLTEDSKIEEIPMNKDVKEIILKILEQNQRVLEQNARILDVLGRPMMVQRLSSEELKRFTRI